jgi:A/G-specific adenine glycosylase
VTDIDRHDFAARLLEWYGRSKRTLPWRDIDDAYAILVSEVMLQQTQVATVVPYFERFLAAFPTAARLAAASDDEVLLHWQGLGYYSRARRLRQAAKRVVDVYDGEIPDTVEELRTLPGIGPYTAGAVASIAFRKPEPIVDANVARVLARVFAVEGDPRSGATSRSLWAYAAGLVSRDRPHDFNVGLMELGALVCTPATPECTACPVAGYCSARARGETSRFPEIAPRPKTVAVEDIAVLVRRGADILLTQRPDGGHWAGLWELPRVRRIDGETLAAAALRAPLEVCGVAAGDAQPFGALRHSVTHYRIRLHGFAATYTSGEPAAIACADARWAPLADIDSYAVSSPQRRLLELARDDAREPRLI